MVMAAALAGSAAAAAARARQWSGLDDLPGGGGDRILEAAVGVRRPQPTGERADHIEALGTRARRDRLWHAQYGRDRLREALLVGSRRRARRHTRSQQAHHLST
eukprot:1732647-Prymnesium_polylepis.1